MAVVIFIMLFLAGVGAIVAKIRRSGPTNWGSFGDKTIAKAIAMVFCLAVIILAASIPSNWWGLIWFFPAVFVAAVLISMSVNWPEKNWGDRIDGWIWGLSVDIAVDDPRRTSGGEGYQTKYDPTHADYDDSLSDNTPRYAIWGMFITGGVLAVVTLMFWMIVAMGNLAQIPSATPAQSATTPGTASTSAAPSPSNTLEPLPKFSCATPQMVPTSPRSTSTLKPGGVQSCVNGNWQALTGGNRQITVLYHGENADYNYFTFKLDGQDVLIRVLPAHIKA